MRRLRLWNAFLAPGTAWLILLFLVPLGIVVAVSFATSNIVGRPVLGWNPGNYSQVFQWIYLRLLLRSFTYAGLTMVLCLLIGYPVAYTVARYGGRRRNVLIALVVLPWLIDYLVRIYAWVVILGNDGLVNGVLHRIGMAGTPALQITGTPFAVITGLVYSYFPLMVMPLYATLEQLDPALIEAGKDLYAGPRRTFLHVTLPASVQGVVAGCLLVFLPAIGDFATARLLGGPSTYMIGNLISDQFEESGVWPFGAAVTVVLMCFMWIVIVVLPRISGETRAPGPGRRVSVAPDTEMAAGLRTRAQSTPRVATTRRRRRDTKGYDRPRFLLVVTGLTYFYLFAPIVVVVVFSFNDIRSLAVMHGVSFRWYRQFLSDSGIRSSLFASLEIAVSVMLIATVLGTLLAFGLQYARPRLARTSETLLLLTLVAPEIATAVALYCCSHNWASRCRSRPSPSPM